VIRAASALLSPRVMLVDAPFNPITQKIIGAAIEVHRRIGPGLLESTYRRCLESELTERSVRFVVERAVRRF
jgi:hypothetical protein